MHIKNTLVYEENLLGYNRVQNPDFTGYISKMKKEILIFLEDMLLYEHKRDAADERLALISNHSSDRNLA